MTERDARRRFPATSDGLATLALADCLGEGRDDGEDGRASPAAEDVVQVTLAPR